MTQYSALRSLEICGKQLVSKMTVINSFPPYVYIIPSLRGGVYFFPSIEQRLAYKLALLVECWRSEILGVLKLGHRNCASGNICSRKASCNIRILISLRLSCCDKPKTYGEALKNETPIRRKRNQRGLRQICVLRSHFLKQILQHKLPRLLPRSVRIEQPFQGLAKFLTHKFIKYTTLTTTTTTTTTTTNNANNNVVLSHNKLLRFRVFKN